jgi:ankyrin repeat protein
MPRGLSSLYQKLLEKAIEENGGNHGIRQILSTAAVSLRPLSLLELSSACQLHEDEDEETRTQFMREQVASCRLMVIIQAQKVLLLHQSVKNFLTENRTGQFMNIQKAHADLAYRCINLLIQNFNAEQRNALFVYATMQWAEHAHLAKSKFQIEASIAEFFETESECRENWLQSYRNRKLYPVVPHQFSILHVAGRWGIEVLVDHAISKTANNQGGRFIDRIDVSGVTPLKCAAASGHQGVVEKLLGLGECDG